MELYKWYKGDELPDESECWGYLDCIIIFRYKGFQNLCGGRFTFTGKGIDYPLEPFWYGKFPYVDRIRQEDIIRWMPIEFPKDVE